MRLGPLKSTASSNWKTRWRWAGIWPADTLRVGMATDPTVAIPTLQISLYFRATLGKVLRIDPSHLVLEIKSRLPSCAIPFEYSKLSLSYIIH